MDAAVRECARDGEPDRHLAALLAPAEARPSLLAIAAFAADVGRIARDVREPMLGEIRLQWWRDAIDAGTRGERTGHPVADALADAARAGRLSVGAMHRLVDARAADVAGELPADDADLDDHLARTEGLAFALGVAALAGEETAANPALRAAGIAYGLARSLGQWPRLAHRGLLPVPRTRLVAAGIDPVALRRPPLSRSDAAALDMIAAGLALVSRTRLDEARRGVADLPAVALPALLPLAMVEPYLAAQNRAGRDRLSAIAEPTPLTRAWKLWRAWRRRRF